MTKRATHVRFFVLLMLVFLSSCQLGTVRANSSGISLDCSHGQPVGQSDDGRGVLVLNWGPCDVNAKGNEPVALSQSQSYVLQNAINARSLDAWIGTLAGSRVEVGYYLKITTPDGREGVFLNQSDKHQDVQGNHFRQWVLPFNLPAGTRIDIGLAVGIANPEKDCPCGTHAQWFFNRGFD